MVKNADEDRVEIIAERIWCLAARGSRGPPLLLCCSAAPLLSSAACLSRWANDWWLLVHLCRLPPLQTIPLFASRFEDFKKAKTTLSPKTQFTQCVCWVHQSIGQISGLCLMNMPPSSWLHISTICTPNRFDLPKNPDRHSFHFSSWTMLHCNALDGNG